MRLFHVDGYPVYIKPPPEALLTLHRARNIRGPRKHSTPSFLNVRCLWERSVKNLHGPRNL